MNNIESFNRVFSNEVTLDNALEFMLKSTSKEDKLLKQYIISQLEIKYHLYHLTDAIGYYGDDVAPLTQILQGKEPFLWKTIMEVDAEREINNENYITQEDIRINSARINRAIKELPAAIKKKEELLEDTKKYHFIKRREIRKEITLLNDWLVTAETKMRTYQQPKDIPELSIEELELKQAAWNKFLDKYIALYKQKYPNDSSELGVSDFLLEQESKYRMIDNLKKDIVLNYNMYKTIFTTDLSKKSLTEILDLIRDVFINYGQKGLSEVYIDKKYRRYDLPLDDYKENHKLFFETCSKGIDVERDMQDLNDEFNKFKQVTSYEDSIKYATSIFQRFIQIHPYDEGNGRTSRYLLSAMLLSKNIMPPVLYETYTERSKLDDYSNEYLLNSNPNPLNNYILSQINIINNNLHEQENMGYIQQHDNSLNIDSYEEVELGKTR